MKIRIILTCFSLCITFLFSQNAFSMFGKMDIEKENIETDLFDIDCDTIWIKNNDIILSQIIEIAPEGIYYNLCPDETGNKYLIKTENIVKYSSAMYQKKWKTKMGFWNKINLSLYGSYAAGFHLSDGLHFDILGLNIHSDITFVFPNEKINLGITAGRGYYLSAFGNFDDGGFFRIGPKIHYKRTKVTWTAEIDYFVHKWDTYNQIPQFYGGLIGIGLHTYIMKHIILNARVNILRGVGWSEYMYTYIEPMLGVGWRF